MALLSYKRLKQNYEQNNQIWDGGILLIDEIDATLHPSAKEKLIKLLYNEAKELMDNMLKRINAIISISAEGGDPEIADLTEDTCGGSCSSCAGCH